MEQKDKKIVISSIDGYQLKYTIKVLPPHLEGTLIHKHFFGPFETADELILEYPDDVVKMLIPLIRQNHLCVPIPLYITDFGNLLKYLACDNKIWTHYAVIMRHSIVDIMMNYHDLSKYTGRYFDEITSTYYSYGENDKWGKDIRKAIKKKTHIIFTEACSQQYSKQKKNLYKYLKRHDTLALGFMIRTDDVNCYLDFNLHKYEPGNFDELEAEISSCILDETKNNANGKIECMYWGTFS